MELFYTKNGTEQGWNHSRLRMEQEWNRSILRTERGDRNVLRLRMERDGWNRSSNKERQERNGTGRPFFYFERNGTERERNDLKKTEQEQNNLAEGPRSRLERNDFKKVGTCPALVQCIQAPKKVNPVWSIIDVCHNRLNWSVHIDAQHFIKKI